MPTKKSSSNSRFRKITIHGTQIQGVELREKIWKYARRNNIHPGYVKNNKEDGTVEIVCPSSSEELFSKCLEDIRRDEYDLIKIDKIESSNYIYDCRNDEFLLKREDDLHEMVWALQGAGRIFGLVEKRRIKGNIRALKYELISIRDWLDLVAHKKASYPFEPIALNNVLIQCPLDGEVYDAIYDNLSSIRLKIQEINHHLTNNKQSGADSVASEYLKKYNDICGSILESMEKKTADDKK